MNYVKVTLLRNDTMLICFYRFFYVFLFCYVFVVVFVNKRIRYNCFDNLSINFYVPFGFYMNVLFVCLELV